MTEDQPAIYEERTFTSQREAEAFLSEISKSIASVCFAVRGDAFRLRYERASLGQSKLHWGGHSALSFTIRPEAEQMIFVPEQSSVRLSTPEPIVALPCGSRSINSTRRRVAASEAARLTAVVVLPTPPF